MGQLDGGSVFNTGFADVDATSQPSALVSHQDRINSQAAILAYKQQAHAMLGLRPGDRVLDVGCGSGDDVRALARIVGPTGRAVGVDISETMVSSARFRSKGWDLPDEFQTADAYQLDFSDAAFDAGRADRVLHHLDDPGRGLRELTRVVRPGGRVVVSEPDFETFVIDHPDHALTRRILTVYAPTAPATAASGATSTPSSSTTGSPTFAWSRSPSC